MAFSATFKYNNLDATTDLNLPTRILSAKGVVSGLGITPVAGTTNITVAAGYLVSYDGMIVQSTSVTTLSCMSGIKNYVVFRARYNAPADPTLMMQVLTAANYNSDPEKAWLVLIGVVDLTGVTQVSNNAIDYSTADQVDVQARDNFLGVFNTPADLHTAYPASIPTAQRNGDYALVLVETQSKPALYIWVGGSTNWLSFGNYEDLLLNFSVHTAGVTASGQNAHVTASEKAALTGSYGTPGQTNRFVTEQDTALLLSTSEKAAIDSAITGPNPLSADNPLIADGIPVAVPTNLGVTTTTAADYIKISYGDLSNGTPFFGVNVFTGKLGLDNNGVSTARNWFRLQDEFLAGYADNDGPLYVVDVLTGDGSGSFNPGSDSNVSPIGYWKAPTNAQQTSLRIKFNRVLASGSTVYVSYYAMGSISKLAPQNAYKLPATAMSTSKDSYREINTARIMTLIGDKVSGNVFTAAPGSPAAPSYTFNDSSQAATHSGFCYIGDAPELSYSFYNAVGTVVNGSTVLVVASATNTDNMLDVVDAPFIIEQVYPDNTFSDSSLTYRLHAHSHNSLVTDMRVSFGVSSYAVGYKSAFYLSSAGTHLERNVTCDPEVQIVTAAGTALLPGLALGGIRTGFYNIGSYEGPIPSFYNAVGLTLNGRTAFVFGTNDNAESGLSSGLESPLVFEEALDSDGTSVAYRFAIMQSNGNAATPGGLYFGSATYNHDFTEYGHFTSDGDLHVTRDIYASKIYSGGGQGYMSVTGSGMALVYNSTSHYSYVAGTDTTTIASANTILTGLLRLSGGNETTPAISFTGDSTGTGLYYTGAVGSDAGFLSRRGIGLSIESETVLLVGRTEEYAGGLTAIAAPLIINQHVNGTDVELRVSATRRTSAVNSSSLVLGTSDYVDGFKPVITISDTDVEIALRTTFSAAVNVVGIRATGNGHFGTLISDGVIRGVGSTATTVAFDLGAAAHTGMFGSDSSLGLARSGIVYMSLASGLGGNNVLVSVGLSVVGNAGFQGNVVGTDATWSGTSTFNGPVNMSAISFGSGASASGDLSLTGNFTLTGNAIVNGNLVVGSGSITTTAFNFGAGATATGNLVLSGHLTVTGQVHTNNDLWLNSGLISFNNAAGTEVVWALSHDNVTDPGVETFYLIDATLSSGPYDTVFAIPSNQTSGDSAIRVSRSLRFTNAGLTYMRSAGSMLVRADGAQISIHSATVTLSTPSVICDGYVQATDFRVAASAWWTNLVVAGVNVLDLTTTPRYIVATTTAGPLDNQTISIQLPACASGNCMGVTFTIVLPNGNNLDVIQDPSDNAGGNRLSQGNGNSGFVAHRTGGGAVQTTDIVTITGSMYYRPSDSALVYCWILSH